jgi:hypothetical protein
MRRFPLVLLLLAGCDKAAPAVPRPTVAAVAIRDVVPGYQQWGTEQFTVPKLESGYDQHWYFTEEKRGEKHKAFVGALTAATQKYDAVDVWLLAHGNRYIEWVAEVPAADRARIRLVYNTGAGDSDQGRSWLRLGVQAYVSHPGGNVAPLFYLRFLPLWLEGKPLKDAVDEANKAMKDDLDSSVAKLLENVAGNPGDLKKLEAGTDAELFGNAAVKHAGKSAR